MNSPSELRGEAKVGVMVVDDQVVFRRVARAVIEATAGFEAVGDAASGPEALARADQLAPDLVLMDVQMPMMDGFEATRRLTDAHPDSVVVLISLDDMEGFEPAVSSCGACAFVRKQDLAPRMLRRLWRTHGRGLSDRGDTNDSAIT
jgi:two-component system, NarL family, invasion response regulator UvrY